MLNNQDGMAEARSEVVDLGTILIVEDEVLVSIVIEDFVRDMGARDVRVASDTRQALEFVTATPPDFAILDVHLGTETSLEVADTLADRGIPFVLSSALGEGAIEERHRHRPMLSKPFSDEELRACLMSLVQR